MIMMIMMIKRDISGQIIYKSHDRKLFMCKNYSIKGRARCI